MKIDEELMKEMNAGMWFRLCKFVSTIYPNSREGLPKSTLEAMAIGRPIVTSNAPRYVNKMIEVQALVSTSSTTNIKA